MKFFRVWFKAGLKMQGEGDEGEGLGMVGVNGGLD